MAKEIGDEINRSLLSIIKTTRERMTLRSPETFFFLMSILATLGMIFRIFDTAGPKYGNLDLNEIFGLLAEICIALMIGFLMFLTAFLSLYYDTNFKLVREQVFSSNFYLTRLITPYVRAIVLLVSLTLFLFSFGLTFMP